MSDPDLIHAPFTPEQVKNLNKYQEMGNFHPFTCGKRDKHPYQGSRVIHHQDPEINGRVVDIELDVLIATENGWICPCPGCDYTQQWAHRFMAEPQKAEE
jgi:hypothetical protein